MAKTYKNLYEKIYAFENLFLAWRKSMRGKRSRPDVALFAQNLAENLLTLQDDLQTEQYLPQPYRSFTIADPKPRLISAAPFADRVVHHALCNILEPLFETKFIFDSYACRKGKGTHAAVLRAQQFSRRYAYVLQCDIEHCFPRIDHAILHQQFQRVIACQSTLKLCEKILTGGALIHLNTPPAYFAGDDLFAALRPRGLPIGNLTSQFWANVYLNALDQFVKHGLKIRGYVRYVDDFLLFANDKNTLHEAHQKITQFCGQELRLTLHERRAQVFPTQTGIPFLGWRIFSSHLRLRARNARTFYKRYRQNCIAVGKRKMLVSQLTKSIQGWVAHASFGQTWRLRRSIFQQQSVPVAGSY
jgi:retron-type reverse transcriptase